MSVLLPILHAGGFSWDEALVLAIAILAVPGISWFNGRKKKRQAETESRETSDAVASDPTADATQID